MAKTTSYKVTPEAIADENFKFEILTSEEPLIREVPLTQLIPLDATPIENASYAMRELNQQHMEHLLAALQGGEEFPPMQAVMTTMGVVVYDGYHRWGTYETNLRNIMEEGDPENELTVEQLDSVRQEFMVPVQFNNVRSERDLLQRAFAANLTHGLPASTPSRARYALWLISEATKDNVVLSVRAAATQAGCSHVAVLKMAKKLAAKNKMVDETFVESYKEDYQDIERNDNASLSEEQKVLTAADSALKSLVKAAIAISGFDIGSEDVTTLLVDYAKNMTKTQVDVVISVIQILRYAAPDEMPVQKELTAESKAKHGKRSGKKIKDEEEASVVSAGTEFN